MRENRCSPVKQEGTQLSNYSTISSNSRLIVNCSSEPATSTERVAGGSPSAALLLPEPGWGWRDPAPSTPCWVFWRHPTAPSHRVLRTHRGGEEPHGLVVQCLFNAPAPALGSSSSGAAQANPPQWSQGAMRFCAWDLWELL